MSERAQAEETLRRYRLLAAHSRDVILFIRRLDGRILDANVAAGLAYGYTHEQLLGLTIHDLRADATKAATGGQMAQADSDGLLFETQHRRKDGTTFPVEVSSQGATIAGTRTLISVIRDITERRRAEEALREADRRKGEFLAVLSHELRNPLSAMRAAVQVLERSPPEGEAAARAREVVGRQTQHLVRLVDDLLDVTRISRGKIELRRGRVDLRDPVRTTCEDLRPLFAASGVALRCELPALPLWVHADGTRVAQIAGNLLQNAAKFTPAGGSVEVVVLAAGSSAEVRVRDTGLGIEPDRVAGMFEPFTQGDRTLARAHGGLGLGLALVKGLVELHGGAVRAHSEGPGRGAEFAFSLPLARARDAGAPALRAGNGPLPVLPLTILVVDDNADGAHSLADLLAFDGHVVRVALDGRSGIALARELRPDLVLCDIGLPDVDGYRVARELRADGALARARLVALSGYAQPEDVDRAREAGFDAHLAKPPSAEALAAELRAAAPA